MDDRLYYMFMTLLLAFQTQFRNIMENRSGRRTAGLNEHGNLLERPFQSEYYLDLNEGLNKHGNLLERPFQPADYLDLNELTEIEQQTFALEEDLRRAMIEISRSPRSLSRWRKDLMALQQQLENLQAQLRTEIGTLSQSRQQHQMRIIFSRISMLKHQKQLADQERRGMFSRSCPNIPSELYDSDFDLIKWMSLNASLDFREEPEVIRKMFDNIRNLLYTSHNPHMKKKKKTSALHNSILSLDPSQQGPMRETDHPHWNQTHSRSQNLTDDDGIRRSSAPEQPDHESDSPRVRQTALRALDVSSLIAQHISTIRTATNQTRPSQDDDGIRRSASSAQLDYDSNSPRVKKAKQDKVPTTELKPVVKSCGSPSFSETNISTAIYKTMTAICARIFMAIYF
ncbi:hypothetical protein D5F01_LYC15510 [Larimichthys crocea]|uniref:Uncharacterized protein n=1 Tax=Larimichthys crocea TaxID=215358 RepID=A0A6G0I3I8_LARCR|nr:hypothetical protein D5F01_LYC15510 [Larimichthys crocea]